MSEADGGDDLFDDVATEDVGPEVEHVGGPRRLLVILGIVMAGFVFIGVAGATLIFYFVLRVRDHTDPNHTVRAKYSHRYTTCVRDGGTRQACSVAVIAACEKDGWWRQAARVGQRETVCLATVPNP